MNIKFINTNNSQGIVLDSCERIERYITSLNHYFINSYSWLTYAFNEKHMKDKIENESAPKDFIDKKGGYSERNVNWNSGAYAEINASTELFLFTKSIPIGFIGGVKGEQKYGLDIFSFSPNNNEIIIGEVKNYKYYLTATKGHIHNVSKSLETALKAALESLFWKKTNSRTVDNVKQNFLNAKTDFWKYSESHYDLIKSGIKELADSTLSNLAKNIETLQESKKQDVTSEDHFFLKKEFNSNGTCVMRHSIFLILNDITFQEIELNLCSGEEIENIIKKQVIDYFEKHEDIANFLVDDVYVFFTPWTAKHYSDRFLEEFLTNEYWKEQWNRWDEENPDISRFDFMVKNKE